MNRSLFSQSVNDTPYITDTVELCSVEQCICWPLENEVAAQSKRESGMEGL